MTPVVETPVEASGSLVWLEKSHLERGSAAYAATDYIAKNLPRLFQIHAVSYPTLRLDATPSDESEANLDHLDFLTRTTTYATRNIREMENNADATFSFTRGKGGIVGTARYRFEDEAPDVPLTSDQILYIDALKSFAKNGGKFDSRHRLHLLILFNALHQEMYTLGQQKRLDARMQLFANDVFAAVDNLTTLFEQDGDEYLIAKIAESRLATNQLRIDILRSSIPSSVPAKESTETTDTASLRTKPVMQEQPPGMEEISAREQMIREFQSRQDAEQLETSLQTFHIDAGTLSIIREAVVSNSYSLDGLQPELAVFIIQLRKIFHELIEKRADQLARDKVAGRGEVKTQEPRGSRTVTGAKQRVEVPIEEIEL